MTPKWVLLGITLVLVAFDVWAVNNSIEGDTLTYYIRWVSQHSIVPFAFGVLMGHLFWT